MSCSNCCNELTTCGYGVGRNAPAGTRQVGVMILNDSQIVDVNANSFSVNAKYIDANGNFAGSMQVILSGTQFLFIGHDNLSGNHMITIPNISFVTGRCYFLGMTIQISPTRKLIATVKDSTGNTQTVEILTNGSRYTTANVKIERDFNTYMFWIPNWGWTNVSGCGVTATFWSSGFVYEGQQANCDMSSNAKKIDFFAATSKIKLGPSASSYKACGSQLF